MVLLCWMFFAFDVIFQIFFIHSNITAVIGLFTSVVHCIFCICYSKWKTGKREDWAELSYKEFKNLYAVIPDDFCLKPYWISYKGRGLEFKSYLDYLKYKIFFKRKEIWEAKIKKMRIQAELIKELKEELKKAEKENEEWVKQQL